MLYRSRINNFDSCVSIIWPPLYTIQ
uniref:Uncharacterized protein n=1 Tax=Arundo donax TaxID=35708 RepID=A0A0A9QCL5_ARUDO